MKYYPCAFRDGLRSQWSSVFRFVKLICGLGLLVGAASATTVVPPEFDELVRESDFVVRTKVLVVRSEWLERGNSRAIVTKVELEVLELIAGEAETSVTLTMLGGKVGEREMVVEGSPKFVVGQEDILFVQGNGRQVVPLTAMMHGRYRVLHDKESDKPYIARGNGEPLTETTQVAAAMHPGGHEGEATAEAIERALTPSDFVSKIRAVKRSEKEDGELQP
jgi:hypothetical protein